MGLPSWRAPTALGLLLFTQGAYGFIAPLSTSKSPFAPPSPSSWSSSCARRCAAGPTTDVAPVGIPKAEDASPPRSSAPITTSTAPGSFSPLESSLPSTPLPGALQANAAPYPASNNGGPRTGSTSRPTMVFVEEIDFCLQPSSEGGSSGSCSKISKTLNTVSNYIAKKILIGVDYCFGEMVEETKRNLIDLYGDTVDMQAACNYVDAVAALSPCLNSDAELTRAKLQDPYKKAYEKLFETLLGHGCEFRAGAGLNNEQSAKMVAKDQDICLSLLDTLSSQTTKTKVLNTLTNRVTRTMLYGGEDDAAKLLKELEAGKDEFLAEWVGEQRDCDESLYYSSLVALLRNGLDTPTPAFHGAYANAYQRLVMLLVKELGSNSAPVNGELFDQFIRWESALRKNLTLDMWDAHPRELTGEWKLYDEGQTRPLRIIFRRDGSIKVPPELGMGGQWRVEPGPTHLDTIFFDVMTGSPDNRVLSYTGYVDRGQRIETRFSKRPIKVQGRMELKIRGESRMSSKFSMEHPTQSRRVLGGVVKAPIRLPYGDDDE